MTTTKHTGKGKLVKRLSAQVGSRRLAENILKKRGQMTKDGKLTAKGKKRNAKTAAQRAKERAAKKSGKSVTDYKYNVKTNTATLKNKR